jgi:toxin-antitoxin system PIN domain toxin
LIGLDTNLLVYAHRLDSAWHGVASKCLKELCTGYEPWGIPWPCLHEFYAVVTHPRIYDPPSAADEALAQIDAWIESPSLVVLSEGSEYWPTLRSLIRNARVTGPRVHDARVAAICLAQGVRELWTADRDFSRFSTLRTRNPLV